MNADRSLSGNKDSSLIRYIYYCVKRILAPFIRAIWIKRVEELKNLPPKGPVCLPFALGGGKRILADRYYRDEGMDTSRSYCYSDHISDIPLMNYVGHPLAVNPGRP